MKLFLLIIGLGWGSLCQAQDMHYWTQQFGARAALLGGAVIHGSDDNSAVYYNPANLAFIKQNTVSLNTSLYQYEDVTIKNGAGENVDLNSQKISLYENMISGLLTEDAEQKYRLGFNILTRSHANFEYSKQHEGFFEVIPQQIGKEYYIGKIEWRTNISETWSCLGAGYRLSDNFSVGLTSIFTYRSQKHSLVYSGRALNAPDSAALAAGTPIFMASNSFNLYLESNIIGILFKAGLHGRFGAWRLGLNISSPSMTLWGESKVQREETQTNLPGNKDQIKTDEQDKLKTKFRYPLTIGTGIGYLYSKGMISLAAEYYTAVQPYEMIQADATDPTFPYYLSNGVEKFLTVYNGANAVFNFGLGWEHQLTEKIKLHLGIRTDFTYAKKKVSGLAILSTPVDIYHLSLGFSYHRKASKVSVGLNYGYAYQKIPQIINLSDPIVDQSQKLFLFGQTNNNASLSSHSFALLIGYTYYFALK